MKAVIALCLIVVAAVAYAKPNEKYPDKYDNIDLDEILSNQRVLKNYCDCILDKGKCTAEGKELKDRIQDALETKCSKCTDAQKEGTRKVIKHLVNKEPEVWKELCAKYDPEGKWTKEYEKELKEVQA